jgi:hypothetical protein
VTLYACVGTLFYQVRSVCLENSKYGPKRCTARRGITAHPPVAVASAARAGVGDAKDLGAFRGRNLGALVVREVAVLRWVQVKG